MVAMSSPSATNEYIQALALQYVEGRCRGRMFGPVKLPLYSHGSTATHTTSSILRSSGSRSRLSFINEHVVFIAVSDTKLGPSRYSEVSQYDCPIRS